MLICLIFGDSEFRSPVAAGLEIGPALHIALCYAVIYILSCAAKVGMVYGAVADEYLVIDEIDCLFSLPGKLHLRGEARDAQLPAICQGDFTGAAAEIQVPL